MMKKLIILSTLFISNLSFAQFSGGTGTLANPYQIATKMDLKLLSDSTNYWDNYFIQTTDINLVPADFLPGGSFYNSGLGFNPIGTDTLAFTGSYNGSNYNLNGLFINRPTQDYIGVFGKIGLNSTIENLVVIADTIVGKEYVGGLIGEVNSGNIINCSVIAAISGNRNVGGIIGRLNVGSISKCNTVGSVYGQYFNIGGLVGLAMDLTTTSNCYSTMKVNGNSEVGGIQGYCRFAIINNCYTTGLINGITDVGGLAGNNDGGTIENCYSIGAVNGNLYVGGFVGFNGGTINNCFFDTISSGLNDNNGATPQSTLLMKTQSTFTNVGWDFVGETTNGTLNLWMMGCSGYPVLTNLPDGFITYSRISAKSCISYISPSGNTYSTSGVYIETLNNVIGCDSIITINLIINNPVDNSTSYNPSTATINANQNNASYQWIDCSNNTAIAGETNQAYTATTNGSYAVVVTSGACSDTSACVVITTVGIKDFSNIANGSIYPNPTSGMFTVSGFETGTKIEVLNVIGEVIYRNVTTDTKINIDLSNESNGVYFIKTTNGFMYKIVKQN